jgi:hypothetical protein
MSSTGNFTSDYIRHTYKKKRIKDYMIYELSASEGKVNLLYTLGIKQFQGIINNQS